MRKRCVGALLALLLAQPAAADKLLVAADIAACKSLNQLSLKLQQAGSVMDLWVRGAKPTRQAEKELDVILQAFSSEEGRFAHQQLPPQAQGLQQGVLNCARQRRKALEDARALANSDNLSSSILRNYWRATLESTRVSQLEWFRVRKNFVKLSLQGALSPALKEFYGWQTAILDKWLEESEISAQAQLLLVQSYDTDGERIQLAEQGRKLIGRSLYLESKTELINSSPSTSACQAGAVSEQKALIRVCEAIYYIYDQPSADSTSNLRSSIGVLSDRSNDLEATALTTLEKAAR